MAIVRLSGGSSVTRASGYAKSLMVQEFALVTLDMISQQILNASRWQTTGPFIRHTGNTVTLVVIIAA